MSISRDEAREVAVVGLLATIALRVGAGVLQMIEELTGQWTVNSALGRLFAPIGSTVGILALAAVLLVVLSPSGSVTPSVTVAVHRAAAVVTLLGVAASVTMLVLSPGRLIQDLWIAMINGLAATTLGGTAWWIIRNFDQDR